MPVTIPATKVHRSFHEVVKRVVSGREHFIVERDDLPVVAIISMAEYEEFVKQQRLQEQRIERFKQLARSAGEEAERQGLTEEDVERMVEETRKELHQENYGDNQ
jgi:prevent-host-death family protein